jgi:hypothetical protein
MLSSQVHGKSCAQVDSKDAAIHQRIHQTRLQSIPRRCFIIQVRLQTVARLYQLTRLLPDSAYPCALGDGAGPRRSGAERRQSAEGMPHQEHPIN